MTREKFPHIVEVSKNHNIGFLCWIPLCLAISYSLVCGLQCHNDTCGCKPAKIPAFVIISDLRAVLFFWCFNGFGLCQTIYVVSGRICGDLWNISFGFSPMLNWGQFWVLLSRARLLFPSLSLTQSWTESVASSCPFSAPACWLTLWPNDLSHLMFPQKQHYTGFDS